MFLKNILNNIIKYLYRDHEYFDNKCFNEDLTNGYEVSDTLNNASLEYMN